MKNDFDFLKDQIENSGVSAPEQMDRDYALDTLRDVQPLPQLTELRPKRRWYKAIPAVAAALVVVGALSVALGVHFANKKGPLPELKTVSTPGGLTLKQFNSYDEISGAVSAIRSLRSTSRPLLFEADFGSAGDITSDSAKAGAVADSNTSSSSLNIGYSGTGGGSYSETYTQVEGVDEADIIKTDGRYIYCVGSPFGGSVIDIFSAQGTASRKVATVTPSDDIDRPATSDERAPDSYSDYIYDGYYYDDQMYVSEIYIKGDRLIALCSDYTAEEGTLTRAMIYDVSDISHITLLDTMGQSGYLCSSRMIGDTLYTVTSHYPYEDDVIPLCGRGSTPDQIPADCVYAMERPGEESFLIVSAYDTLDYQHSFEQKAILGGGDTVYCNLDNMYITVTEYRYVTYGIEEDLGALTDMLWPAGENDDITKTQILKVSLTDGIAFTAYTEVEGYIDSQYSLDEYNGYLRVATTTTNEDGRDTNCLFVLDGDLTQVGAVDGFAEDESIKAVRYMGETAYVITYEQTDPLFVIDLSNPAAPAILGSVKIDGFSTMLVPLSNDMVLGLGYHTTDADYTDLEVQDGFKLVLFDVSDKTAPKVLDTRVYEECYSEVMYNPKALVYNPDRDDYLIPLNYAHYDYDEENDYYHDEMYGGFLNFSVRAGHLIENERDNVISDSSVERCVYVGDCVYYTYYDDGELLLEGRPYR